MQINRLFEIIYILLNNKTVTARQLADKFEVSARTIYRDIETLSSCGIPIYMNKGKGGGISLLDNFVLNKTTLTEKEKSEIMTSLQALKCVDGTTDATALRKLSTFLGRENTDWIEIDFSSWGNQTKEQETFNLLKSAVITRHTVRFSYSNVKGESTTREVNPIKLYFKSMARYLYGYCHKRNEYRMFKLSRINNVVMTESTFVPDADIPQFCENNSFTVKLVDIKLRIDKRLAFRAYDEFADIEQLKNGDLIVKCAFPDEKWLVPYILSFGSSCEVLTPLELRQKVQEELIKTEKNYL